MRWTLQFVMPILCALACVFTTNAEEKLPVSQPHIEISSKDIVLVPGTASEGATIKNISSGPEDKRNFSLVSSLNTPKKGEWNTFVISFTPKTDGRLTIKLGSRPCKSKGKTKPDEMWVFFASVLAEGATIANGTFAEAKNGTPALWTCGKGIKYITAGEGALSGKTPVSVWYMQRVSQTIDVKGGQEVKLTFTAMPGEPVLSAE